MKTPTKILRGNIQINESSEGETLEQQIEKMVNNKEPIKDGAPLVYTERVEGIRPEMNIRTDRWEIAIDAMDKVSASYKARREERMKKKETDETEPIQGTAETKKAS